MSHIQPRNPALRFKRQVSVLGIALLASAGAAQADSGDEVFSFNGFGTVGFGHSSSTDGDYVPNLIRPTGPGASHDWTPLDNVLGGQLTAKVNEQFSAVVQVVAMTRPNGNFAPKVEWAYLKYALTPELSVLVGRTLQPGFMASETRMVGFSNPWVRPPLETYNQNPTTNLDGINASFRNNLGGVTNTLQGFYGKTEITVISASGAPLFAKVNRMHGFADTVEYGTLSVRGSLNYFDLAVPLPGFTINASARQANLGVSYDPGNWFVQGELATSNNLEIVHDVRSMYVTAGVRIHAFTPYATYSRVRPHGAPALITNEQTSTSIGLRWDVIKNVAVKTQLDHVSVGPNSAGYFVNVKPAMLGGSSNIASVAVDFVY